MSGASTLQRNSQRRTPTASEDLKGYQYNAPPAPAQPSYNGGQASISTRSSSGSGGMSARSGSGRKRDPSQQLSQIEKSVTHLLIATKQLLETLTQWSRHQATEGEVSDVYVRLGYEFNIACRAFTSIGVDVSDLGNVPDLLRAILEDTLSQDPSPASLDRYLPRIRDIIINLLHGLKRKQQKLRTRPGSHGQANAPRQGSMISSLSGGSDLDTSAITGDYRLSEGTFVSDRQSSISSAYPTDELPMPPRASTLNQNGSSLPQQDQIDVAPPPEGSARGSKRMVQSSSDPYSSIDITPSGSKSSNTNGTSMENPGPPPLPPTEIPKDFPAPPPVPAAQPRAQDALAALQRGGELERRASRRYSAYQIQKHLGQSPASMPMIPPTQHGPIPNRGKEQRDSLNAVRSRSSLIRQRSSRFADISPSRAERDPKRTSGEQGSSSQEDQQAQQQQQQQQDRRQDASPFSQQQAKQQDDAASQLKSPTTTMTATVSGPMDFTGSDYNADLGGSAPSTPMGQQPILGESSGAPKEDQGADTEEPFVPAQSPEPGKPLTLFLQYKSKIKKYVLPDGSDDLTVGRLQLAFIEKFAWHGVDLPEIYVQDPVSGVRHELEDLTDVKDRTVLVLNVEAVDEVKRHFDGALGGIRTAIEDMRAVVEKQQSSIQQVTTKQDEASKELSRLASQPSSAAPGRAIAGFKSQANGIRNLSGEHMADVQTLRRDLAVMRQTLSTFTSGVKSSMGAIREKAEAVKAKAVTAALPLTEAEQGRAYVNAGKKTVGDDSEALVNRVDDLQDIVEDLRKDVTRGVRPLPDQLKTVSNDINTAGELLKKMKATVKKEKPTWTKIWEKELELVCTDREFLTLQEELIADLEDDLEKANQTFALVQEATKQQQQQGGSGGNGGGIGGVTLRSTSRGFGGELNADPEMTRAGVLGEVRALQPNHESRLEAIERAEKARKKELATRKDGPFLKELSKFVDDGKLRKTGGVDEIERVRLMRDDANLKVTWEVEQADKAERKKERMEKKKREAAERAAQAAAAAEEEEAWEAEEAAAAAAAAAAAGGDNAGGEEEEERFASPVGNGGSEESNGMHAAGAESQNQHQPHQQKEGGGGGPGGTPTFDDFAQNGFQDAAEHHGGLQQQQQRHSPPAAGQGEEGAEGPRRSWLPAIFQG